MAEQTCGILVTVCCDVAAGFCLDFLSLRMPKDSSLFRTCLRLYRTRMYRESMQEQMLWWPFRWKWQSCRASTLDCRKSTQHPARSASSNAGESIVYTTNDRHHLCTWVRSSWPFLSRVSAEPCISWICNCEAMPTTSSSQSLPTRSCIRKARLHSRQLE